MKTFAVHSSLKPAGQAIVSCDLSISGLRRSLFYQPLAVVLSILLLPVVSWLEFGNQDGGKPFHAHAQVGNLTCNSKTNTIIQNYCDTSGDNYAADLIPFESDSVNGYLALHGLQAGDASVIYNYGRSDLRSAVRAVMLTTLLGIIAMPASSRSAHQQALFAWFQNLVQHNEIVLYQQAIAQYNAFMNDPCTFTLDPVIAAQYNLTYDGKAFCGISLSSVFAPPVPAESYFTAYGLKDSYGATASTYSQFGNLVAETGISAGEIDGIGSAGATVAASVTGSGLYANLSSALAVFVADGDEASISASTTFAISGISVNTLGLGAAVAGPAFIVFSAILIGIVAGLQVFNQQQTINDMNGLSATLANLMNTPPDLNALINDSSGLGMYKLQTTLVSETAPDVPSTTGLPAHQPGVDMSFLITPQSGSSQVSGTLGYQDWSGNSWSVQAWGGWFVGTCSTGTNASCPQKDTINASLQYVDWSGVNWTASRQGTTFVSTKASPASTDVTCPADPATGISLVPNPSVCKSYTSVSLPVMDSGAKLIVQLTPSSPPHFPATATPLTFSLGVPSTLTIVATGDPSPTVCVTSSGLDSNFTVPTCTGSTITITYNGSLSEHPGTYTLQLLATNNLGMLPMSFPITVANNLNIISPNTFSGTWGVPFSFTVVATGNPAPTLSFVSGPLDLDGLTFKDNGNGTGTLSGAYSGNTFGTQVCVPGNGMTGTTPCGAFVATNSQGTVTQTITPTFAQAPSAVMTISGATFSAGVPNQLLLTTYGAVTPVTWSYTPDPGATWLALKDNGNGTAVLSGTPPPQTSGTFHPSLGPVTQGTISPIFQFPVTVVNTPIFTTSNAATFTVGTQGAFPINVNLGTLSATGSLPEGLQFVSGSSLFNLFGAGAVGGTPAVGTGGQYPLTVTDTATSGATQQSLTVNVNEGPTITSPNLVTLFAGVPGSFTVSTLGFPVASTHPVSLTSPPTDPSQGNGMYFTVTGLPASLQSSNLTPQGLATGTLSITGTPTAGDLGAHKVQITAQNAVGTPARQTLTLQVYPLNTATPVNLLTSSTLARDSSNDVIVTAVVANSGSAAAQNVTIISAKIGSATGTVTPASMASIASGSTATFTISFPAASVGASGTLTSLILSGTYTGGTFNSGGRIVLP